MFNSFRIFPYLFSTLHHTYSFDSVLPVFHAISTSRRCAELPDTFYNRKKAVVLGCRFTTTSSEIPTLGWAGNSTERTESDLKLVMTDAKAPNKSAYVHVTTVLEFAKNSDIDSLDILFRIETAHTTII